jgi:hypothetical protein
VSEVQPHKMKPAPASVNVARRYQPNRGKMYPWLESNELRCKMLGKLCEDTGMKNSFAIS